MTAATERDGHQPWVALFDLDGTLTWRDTLMPFLIGYLRRRPSRWLRLWRLLPAVFAFMVGGRDRGLLKSRVIRAVMGGETRTDIDSWAEVFVGGLMPQRRLRPAALAVLAAHREAGDRLILLSASPDLYVPRIGRALGFERSLCTELQWSGERLDGTLNTPNRRGAEKLRCLERLRAEYPGLPIVAYGNSATDLAHMKCADRALLVNATAAARRAADQCGIPSTEWT